MKRTIVVAVLFACAIPVAHADEFSAFRRAHGLRPLSASSQLAAMAQSHAQDMARRDHLDHRGFMEQRGPAGSIAENVAYGYGSADLTFKQWERSPPHRANMLLSMASSYGVASAVSASGKHYWALEIGQ